MPNNIILFSVVMHDFYTLYQSFPAQQPPRSPRNNHRDDDGDDKPPRTGLHAVDEVHAEEARDERGKHHDDAHRGQRTHHGIHVVVDDARIGLHRRFQDVGIDVGGFACLRHLNAHVFDEVGIELVHLQFELQLLQQRFVSANRSDEVGERVLQPAQPDEAFVVHLLV